MSRTEFLTLVFILNQIKKAYARDRLIQSHKAYLARIRPAAAQQRTPSKQSQTKSSQTSQDSPRRRRQQPQINGTANIQTNTCSPNQSDQSIMIPRMAAMKLQDGGVQTKSEVNIKFLIYPKPIAFVFESQIRFTFHLYLFEFNYSKADTEHIEIPREYSNYKHCKRYTDSSFQSLWWLWWFMGRWIGKCAAANH